MTELNKGVFPSFQQNLVQWYKEHKRELPWRLSQDPYRVWVSEIMLQQTRVDTVIPYYERFMREFPSMEDLAEAEEDRLLKVWEGLGYYSRVRNLQSAVREVVEEYASQVPRTRKQVESLKGVGPYTAGAILSIAYDLPEPAVDGNVMRVLSRVFCIEADIAKPKTRKIHEEILYELIDKQDPSSFNQGLMELGALICTPTSPGCLLCPVREQCQAYEMGRQGDLPIKSKKKKAKVVKLNAFVLTTSDGRFVIEKRPNTGLLAGLWQLPMTQIDAEESHSLANSYVVESDIVKQSFQVRHVFSHLIWEIDLYAAKVSTNEIPETAKFVERKDLEGYAFPVSQQKLLTYCLEEELL